ncbi:MAG: SPOR domain-containing protein [Treponema sp.]|nr:SPOR domain-containing protein [Treponema sp.]
MKTIKIAIIIIAYTFLSAAVFAWEGYAAVAPSGDLPEDGLSIATNAFPVNTVVDITNLENYVTLRVIVVSDLDSPGLLATVSGSVAQSLGIHENYPGRIFIRRTTDETAYSLFRQHDNDPFPASPDPVITDIELPEPLPAVVIPPETDDYDISEQPPFSAYSFIPDSDELDTDIFDEDELPVFPAPIYISAIDDLISIPETASEPDSYFFDDDSEYEVETIVTEPSVSRLSIITSEERIPPIPGHVIPDEYFVPPVQPEHPSSVVTGRNTQSGFSPFRAPLITELERNMWYVQIGAYSRPDNVENEINRMGMHYPIVIQNIGTNTNPTYRVLLGPLNRGESAAMLQRVKSIGYCDAFIRRN